MASTESPSSQSTKSGLAIFTHRMRERVGLAEKAIRNEGVKELSKRLDTVGEHLKLMMKGIQKTTSCLKELSEAGVELSSQLTDCSVKFASDPERILLSGACSTTAEFERVMEDTRLKLALKVEAEVVGAIRGIYDTEVAQGKHQMKVYESARVDLSTAQTKLATAQKGKQQPKIDAAQAELDVTKRTFDTVERETLVKVRDAVTVAEYKLLECILRYVETQKDFYNRGYQMLNTTMVDVAEYRRHSDESRRKLAAKPVNPRRVTIRMSVAPKTDKKKLFGVSLADLEMDGRCVDGVPIFFLTVVLYVERWGISEEGIFRVAGNHNKSDAIRLQIEQSGGEYDWGVTGEKILNATDLLKQFLRELPSPLLTQDFVRSALNQKGADAAQAVTLLINLVKSLPIASQRILKLLFMLLHKISQEKSNRMSPVALATCMGPNLTSTAFPEGVDPFEVTGQINSMVAFIISHAETVFQHVVGGSPPSSPRNHQDGAEVAAPVNAKTDPAPSSPQATSSMPVNPGVQALSNHE